MATSTTFPVKAGELVNYAIAEHIENAGRASQNIVVVVVVVEWYELKLKRLFNV